MRVAITGGTGLVGRHVAAELSRAGHETVLVARGVDKRHPEVRGLAGTRFAAADIGDAESLATAFEGCDGVAHCAGINREIGEQTYERIHVEGTRNIVEAARRAGARKVALVSFLRARPGCGSPYHESKFAAEEIVRASGLDFTIIKPGVIYGIGDHMLDHLSRAFHTFPVFGLVGFRDRPVRPVAVEEVARILAAALVEGRLSRETIAVLGPEQLPLGDAVRRVAGVVGRRPLMIRMPIAFHRLLAIALERTMGTPLVSKAQVRILSEGIVEPLPPCEEAPDDLHPRRPFSEEQIRRGLPEPGGFTREDLRLLSFRSKGGVTK